MRIAISLITFWIIFFSVGCQTNPGITDAPAATATSPEAPSQVDHTPMSTPTIPPDTGLGRVIQLAKEDLAQRLSISTDQIQITQAYAVEWSDSSLGCPQADMAYLQVITPGYFILLESSGNMYEYHSNRDTYIVYCQNPTSPFLPKP